MSTMILETIRSDYLAHLSYILIHKGKAAVIDPRRDCQAYIDLARQHGASISRIFETHRNEDYVTGSRELARRTGAQIMHGKGFPFDFGAPVSEGDWFDIGDLRLTVLETPGHTFDSISLVLRDMSSGEDPVAVFTGDALFIGDVGRTDFYPDRREEVAGLLYDSIFGKLLPLGDHVILYPAHGAGSVCGSGMAQREFSTLGFERRHNPALQLGREAFVRRKAGERHEYPPYFRKMEEINAQGSDAPLCEIREPKPLGAEEFAKLVANGGAQVVDVRSPEAIAGAFVPGSLAIPEQLVSGYAGYLLDYGQPIYLVAETQEEMQSARAQLLRMGYDRVEGWLAGGLTGWETAGRQYDSIPAVNVRELVRRIQADEDFTLLDVRKQEEVEAGMLPGARHIFLGDLPNRLTEIPRDKPVTTFCGSGQRAVIAASILKRHGFERVEDNLGSMAACRSYGCPIVEPGTSGKPDKQEAA
ncbi:MBL fold metallo-hydrolase [Desulfocurvibacter africanus]|uniref:MBL fold metallo-hydrolase n=1 Tax=Desulfocurvibacter africanus TaxID=873 RepID=UPI0003F6698D|nr:MBL fold metallo-hydrolase [Desulfocurvibacter africanus]